jgi:hypothetical protein
VVSGVVKNTVGPNYFAALSTPLLEGREFGMRDQRMEPSKTQALPVVVNQTAAREFFGSGEPVGRRISDAGKSYEVVGAVKDLSSPLSQTPLLRTLHMECHIIIPDDLFDLSAICPRTPRSR